MLMEFGIWNLEFGIWNLEFWFLWVVKNIFYSFAGQPEVFTFAYFHF